MERSNDWWTVLKRTWNEISADNVEVMSAGVAFFATLSVFPAILGLVLLYGLVADPADLERQLSWLSLSLVPLARQVLLDSVALAGTEETALGIGVLGALLLAIWGASRATSALLLSVQAAYEDEAIRGFFSQLRLNLLVTAGAMLGCAAVLVSTAAASGVLTRAGLPPAVLAVLFWLRWPCLLLVFLGMTAMLYRLAPRRVRGAPRLTIWPGAILATVLWTVVSFGFSFYTGHIDSYDGTYGPTAAFAVFMTWLYLSAYVVIAGAEFNSELARLRSEKNPASAPSPAPGQRPS